MDGDVSRVASRVVFCRHRVPSVDSKLVRSASETRLLLVAGSQIAPDRLTPLVDFGAEVIAVATDHPIEIVRAGLAAMGAKEMTNVMLEGGGELIGSFFTADQVDECHVYIGARAFGGHDAIGPIGGSGISRISNAWTGKLCSLDQFDNDLLAVYRRF
jgi:diaminohydroxyphosphoribosylaminopyrimidine deaminase/5-amino-6-(5-phosphoribosylamino)uracil reductase